MKSEYLNYLKHLIRAPLVATAVFFLFQPFYNQLYQVWLEYSTNSTLFVSSIFSTSIVLTSWSNHIFYFICDHYGYLQRYKIKRKACQIPSQSLVTKSIKNFVLASVTMPVLFYFIVPLLTLRSIVYDANDISHNIWHYITMIFIRFVIYKQLDAWLNYLAHRTLHHPLFYHRFHKQHHEYVGSISLAQEHVHPVEFVLRSIPTTIGPILFGGHVLQDTIWLIWRVQKSLEEHSGFCFRDTFLYKIGLTNADETAHHDIHHTKQIGNYNCTFCDELCGTKQKS